MGMLIDGKWQSNVDRFMQDGAFRREPSALPKTSVEDIARRLESKAHLSLVLSQSCPWCHRVALVRAVKGIASLRITGAGGPRTEGYRLTDPSPQSGLGLPVEFVHQLYTRTDPTYTGRATVPVLWDGRAQYIVSNSSHSIARALDRIGSGWRLRPQHQSAEIDAINTRLYAGLANAVYRAGFATTQTAYADAEETVFETLEWLDSHLADRRCLLGAQITEADLFLFATLVRFDAVYATLFRCTRRRLVDHPVVWAYTRDIYGWPGVAGTIDFAANLASYFLNDTDNNPHGIIPALPHLNWTAPHGRDRLGPLMVWQGDGLRPFEDCSEEPNAP
ncbi:MAG: glutathione S-transferase C-terminal domain-containing protein [Pseudomonadota bacterium]